LRSNACFISDREKGIPNALEEVLPENCQAWCCQHIADNIQTKFSIKCVPLFWPCARAKTKVEFENALKALTAHNIDAGNYVNNIAHNH
jgi:transposase-like protein